MTLNKQTPQKIDWTDYTWNPIGGCRHGCDYCYMLRMAKRFPGVMEPAFRESYLGDPYKIKKPSKFFIGSSGDIWGDWVPAEWIFKVLKVIKDNPQHIFQFLTKNPMRYQWFNPVLKNAWYGTTVDGTERTKNNLCELKIFTYGVRTLFVSFEPLLEPIDPDLSHIDWVIIGANSNRGAEKPPNYWAKRIIECARQWDCAVWVKDNYNYPQIIKEFPKKKL